MKSRKTNVRFDPINPAMTLFHSRYWANHMVYILRADKSVHYQNGRSRIVYIGETKRGTKRPAGSVASKAREAFRKLRGVKKIDVHPLTFKGTQNVKTWEVLERDLLATFNEKHGALPLYNTMGRGFSVKNISRFRKKRLLAIIERLG